MAINTGRKKSRIIPSRTGSCFPLPPWSLVATVSFFLVARTLTPPCSQWPGHKTKTFFAASLILPNCSYFKFCLVSFLQYQPQINCVIYLQLTQSTRTRENMNNRESTTCSTTVDKFYFIWTRKRHSMLTQFRNLTRKNWCK